MMRSRRPLRYGVAVLAVAVVIGLLLIPGLGDGLAGLLFFAVLVAAWYGGLGPGLLATALVVMLLVVTFITSAKPVQPGQVWGAAIFAGLGVLIALIVESLHVARWRAEGSEKWLSAVLTSIGDAVIATDRNGDVVFMNPIAATLTGWTQEDASGKKLEEVFRICSEDAREPVENPVDRVFREGVIVGLANHTLLIARDGTEYPIADSAAPIKDAGGNVRGAVLVFRDATEHRRWEEELRKSDEYRRIMVERVKEYAIFALDPRGRATSWNRGVERVLGFSEGDFLGQPLARIFPPDAVAAGEPEQELAEAAKRGQASHDGWRIRADGTRFWASGTTTALYDPKGQLIGYTKVLRDLTEQRRADEAEREASRRKDEFLAMLAHELRNPLASIDNAFQLLMMSDDDEHRSWATEVIGRQVKHLARLIDDLLDVSRLTRGKIELRKGVLDATKVLADAVETVRPQAEAQRQALRVSLPSAPLWVEADPLRLEQVVLNLLTNAIKYTGDGGNISLSAGGDGEGVAITVRDDGIGIPPEKLPRMFELFEQGDRSLARSEGGLGVGLTIVKTLVELHGGSVVARSGGPNQGSEFTVRLPAAPGPDGADRTEPSSPRPAAAGARVLVVDDNVDTARGMSRLLKIHGHDVRAAHGGPEAIEAALAHRPDFILLDIGLPGMDGYEVARRLREEAPCRDATIIAVSGYGQEEDRRRAREAGFDHHLVKPVDHDALIDLLAKNPPPNGND